MTNLSDPIGDMLTRMRNAQHARRQTCSFPHSKIKLQLCELFKREGYLESVEVQGDLPKQQIEVRPDGGWTFPVGDDAALAAVLQEVLAGGAKVEAIVARGQADAPARFSLERMIGSYEGLFAELLNSAKPVS